MNKSEIIKIKEGDSVQVILETEPSNAKAYPKETEYGPKVSYGIFLDNNRLLFATEALYAKLEPYHKGDALTISFIEKRWLVQGPEGKTISPVKQHLETEQMALLTKIALDIEQIKQKLYDEKTEEKKYPTDVDVDF